MLSLQGIYNNGVVSFKEPLKIDKPKEVIVTFLDDEIVEENHPLKKEKFNWASSRQVTQNLNSKLSDEVIAERRKDL